MKEGQFDYLNVGVNVQAEELIFHFLGWRWRLIFFFSCKGGGLRIYSLVASVEVNYG